MECNTQNSPAHKPQLSNFKKKKAVSLDISVIIHFLTKKENGKIKQKIIPISVSIIFHSCGVVMKIKEMLFKPDRREKD